jgi:hypothetical protein
LAGLPIVVRVALVATAIGLFASAAPSGAAATGGGAPARAAYIPAIPPPPPKPQEVPILFNDHHVYANPDTLKANRVLAALVRGNTVLVPLRSMFEQTGATVSWDPATKTVDVSKPGSDVKVTVGKPEVVINGESRPLDVPPEIYEGAVVVPLRVIAEGMGAYVQWVADQRLVVVRYVPAAPPTAPPPAPTEAPTAAPAPPATPTPSPTPSPKPAGLQAFVAADYVIAPRVYNELTPGTNGTSSWSAHGAVDLPVSNIPLTVSADFRSYQYQHQSIFPPTPCSPTQPNCGTVIGHDGNFQAGSCPSNDPGCVTVIGNLAYQSLVGVGQAYVPAFTAQDRDFDVRLGLKVADPRIYLAAGYYWREYNYLGYPNLSGFGFGIEKQPDLNDRLSLYGSAYFYPSVKGNYTGPTSVLLGPLSGATFNLEYSVIRYRLGLTYGISSMPLFVDLGFLGDKGFMKQNAPSDFSHTGFYGGLGFHI